MSVRFLHLADLHLGACMPMLGAREAERQDDSLRALERAVAFACDGDHAVDAVLVAGDVFDVPDPTPSLVEQVRALTRHLADAGVPVFWIPGTHDAYDDPRCVYRHAQFPGVTLFTDAQYGRPIECTIRDTRVAVSGFAWQAGQTPSDVLDTLPALDPDILHVALLHGSVQSGLDWTVADHYVPVQPAAVAAAPVHYLALGHYHNAQAYETAAGLAYYPGTLEGRRFGENGLRTLAVAQVTTAGAQVETHPWNVRTLRDERLDLDVAGLGDADDVVAWLHEQADADTLLRVTLCGTPDRAIDAAAVHEAAAARFFHLQIRDETELFNSGWIADFAQEQSVRGAFVRKLQARMQHGDPAERRAVSLALKLGVHTFAGHDHAAV